MLQAKDKAGFDYLYENYSFSIYNGIFKILKEEEYAKDVLHEVFIKIWTNILSYDSTKGRLYTWLLKIAHNYTLDVIKSAQYQKTKKVVDIEYHVDKGFEQMNVETMGLQKIVSEMKEDYRQIIDLAYFKGFTQQEIADELGIPIGTVKTRSRNALILLKKIVSN